MLGQAKSLYPPCRAGMWGLREDAELGCVAPGPVAFLPSPRASLQMGKGSLRVLTCSLLAV